jgi:hypothetical protein
MPPVRAAAQARHELHSSRQGEHSGTDDVDDQTCGESAEAVVSRHDVRPARQLQHTQRPGSQRNR